ncbi:unnamed protein product [Lactuca virosa]|uniref:Uncharacterized protein n=1 Tax=Lactuca virosa TaxID=75947 RepID=A0AAU9NSZ1_9ASTR|nr:unnamed protein product [Lactuca virosa]
MEDYKDTYNANTATANKPIQNVGALFQTKKANFVELCKSLQSDHEAFQSSIAANITKLQEDLVTKNKLMDALAIKEENCKVLETKIHYTKKQVLKANFKSVPAQNTLEMELHIVTTFADESTLTASKLFYSFGVMIA